MTRSFHPRKNRVGEREVAGIGFQLINKDAGVDRDPAVAPQKKPKLLYSQLLRSLLTCCEG